MIKFFSLFLFVIFVHIRFFFQSQIPCSKIHNIHGFSGPQSDRRRGRRRVDEGLQGEPRGPRQHHPVNTEHPPLLNGHPVYRSLLEILSIGLFPVTRIPLKRTQVGFRMSHFPYTLRSVVWHPRRISIELTKNPRCSKSALYKRYFF